MIAAQPFLLEQFLDQWHCASLDRICIVKQ